MYRFVIMFTNGQTLEGATTEDLQETFAQTNSDGRLIFSYQPDDSPRTTCRAQIPASQITCLTTVAASGAFA
jgi:hypothetical protein